MPTNACGVPAPIRTSSSHEVDVLQLVDPGDVDEVVEVRQPHGEHRAPGSDRRRGSSRRRRTRRAGRRPPRRCRGGDRRTAAAFMTAAATARPAGRRPAAAGVLRSASHQETDRTRGRHRGEHRREPLGHRHRHDLEQVDGVAGVGLRSRPRAWLRPAGSAAFGAGRRRAGRPPGALANCAIRLPATSASTPRPNCAALPEIVRSVVMTTLVASPSSLSWAVTMAAAVPLPRVSLPLALSTMRWAAASFSWKDASPL